jgi:uncharacterized protein (TIGR00369 family)
MSLPEARPESITIDRMGVSRCFGCGQANEEGLRLQFAQNGDGTIETRHRTAAHHCGLDTVVHGGIQATILDEVMGVAAEQSLARDASDMACVTAEMHLVYKAPVPLVDEVIAEACVERIDGRDIFVTGAIVDTEGRVLTEASSRWRQLRIESTDR